MVCVSSAIHVLGGSAPSHAVAAGCRRRQLGVANSAREAVMAVAQQQHHHQLRIRLRGGEGAGLAFPPALIRTPRRSTERRRRVERAPAAAAAGGGVNLDDVDPVLPPYDMLRWGPLEVSAVALDCSRWSGNDPSAFIAAVDGGVTLYDTTPNEVVLGQWVNAWCVSEAASLPGARAPTLASTCRLAPGADGFTAQYVMDALQAHSISTGGVSAQGLTQVLLECPPEAAASWQAVLADGLKAARDGGYCAAAVGVVGYKPPELQALAAALGSGAGGGPQLVSNKVRYSLLERGPALDGTLDCCRDLGVGVLAASALAGGRLAAPADQQVTEEEGDVAGLLKLLQLVGSFIGGRTSTQVAVNWLIASGVVPLVATENERHAWEVAGATGWRLDENQAQLIGERAEMTMAYELKKQN